MCRHVVIMRVVRDSSDVGGEKKFASVLFLSSIDCDDIDAIRVHPA